MSAKQEDIFVRSWDFHVDDKGEKIKVYKYPGDSDIWIEFTERCSVSLSPSAMRVLIAKIKETPICPF